MTDETKATSLGASPCLQHGEQKSPRWGMMIDRLLLDAILGKGWDSQYENIEEGKNAKNDSAQETQIT